MRGRPDTLQAVADSAPAARSSAESLAVRFACSSLAGASLLSRNFTPNWISTKSGTTRITAGPVVKISGGVAAGCYATAAKVVRTRKVKVSLRRIIGRRRWFF